jgi:AcrR family transcriptional regulator
VDLSHIDHVAISGETSKRSPTGRRRIKILKAAEAEFASTGLHTTTTPALARSAGISKAMLYVHFGSKDNLFKEVVEGNIAARLAALRESLGSIPPGTPAQCVQSMAEFTVMACTSGTGNSAIMAWALLETPEYAVELYRNEIGAVKTMWETQIAECLAESLARTRLAVYLVPYAVRSCLAFGLWLAFLRYTLPTARAHARQHAAGIGQAASAILNVAWDSRSA